MNHKNRCLSPPSKNTAYYTAYYIDYDLWYQAIPSLAEGKGRFGVTEGTMKTIYVPFWHFDSYEANHARATFPAQCGRTCRREATGSSSRTFLGSAFPSRRDSFRYLSASSIRLRCRTLSADMSAMPGPRQREACVVLAWTPRLFAISLDEVDEFLFGMNVQRCVDVAQMRVDGAFRHEKLLLDALSRVALRVKNHDFRGALAQACKTTRQLGPALCASGRRVRNRALFQARSLKGIFEKCPARSRRMCIRKQGAA